MFKGCGHRGVYKVSRYRYVLLNFGMKDDCEGFVVYSPLHQPGVRVHCVTPRQVPPAVPVLRRCTLFFAPNFLKFLNLYFHQVNRLFLSSLLFTRSVLPYNERSKRPLTGQARLLLFMPALSTTRASLACVLL